MNQLGLFAKYWEPGQVKTRLAASLGLEPASRLSLAFLRCLLRRLDDCGDCRQLCFSPPERSAEFAALTGGQWRLEPQVAGDLGQRMQAYFDAAFARSSQRVVLIGSDSPTLPRAHIERAFALLREIPVVLAGASDGGYCLIGAAGARPPIFEGIDWSTGRVYQQTIHRLASAGLRYAELPRWYDIDEFADLERLRQELAQPWEGEPFAELANQVAAVLAARPRK